MKNTRAWPVRKRASRRLLPTAVNPSDRDIARLNHDDLPSEPARAWAEERACQHALARLIVEGSPGRLVGFRGMLPVTARHWLEERCRLLSGWRAGSPHPQRAA